MKNLYFLYILVISFLLPGALFAQEKWLDGIYSSHSPEFVLVKASSDDIKPIVPATIAYYKPGITIKRSSSIYEFPKQEPLKVYPNPVEADSKVVFSSRERGVRYHLYMVSADGKPIFQQSGTTVLGSNTIQLQMSKYPTGMYYLQLFVGDQKQTARVVKAVK